MNRTNTLSIRPVTFKHTAHTASKLYGKIERASSPPPPRKFKLTPTESTIMAAIEHIGGLDARSTLHFVVHLSEVHHEYKCIADEYRDAFTDADNDNDSDSDSHDYDQDYEDEPGMVFETAIDSLVTVGLVCKKQCDGAKREHDDAEEDKDITSKYVFTLTGAICWAEWKARATK